MLKFVKPLLGLFLFVIFAGTLLLTPAAVLANGAEGVPTQAEPGAQDIGGARIDAQSVRDAINSPTPNLANTTAYVFYTLLVLTCSSFSDASACGVQEESLNASPQVSSLKPNNISQAIGDHGAIGGLAFLTSEVVANPPVSAQAYVADVAANSRFGAQPAYAQGFGLGFGALSPILGTWKAFRDVAYYLLTIVFLIVGFLILIRHKVSGNVAVTVQNALPRLVITLILITFSYAIAGLVVDLMFLAIYFVINIFDSQIFIPAAEGGSFAAEGFTADTTRDLALNTHLFSFIFQFIRSGGAWEAAQSLGTLVYQSFALAVPGLLPNLDTTGDTFNLVQMVISIIFVLIFAIALLISMFRTFFQLIMSYAGFVINVVLSPFILLGGAIPGKGDAFSGWLKNLIAGLAPFVVVIFMIFMALALTGINTPDGVGYKSEGVDGGIVDIEGLRLPLVMTGGEINANAVIGVLAMGILLMIPESVEMTKKMIGAKGGIFDEFKDKALGNFKKGWTGGEVIPGVGMSRIPGAERFTFGSQGSRKAASDHPDQPIRNVFRRGLIGGPAIGTVNTIRTTGEKVIKRVRTEGTASAPTPSDESSRTASGTGTYEPPGV